LGQVTDDPVEIMDVDEGASLECPANKILAESFVATNNSNYRLPICL
jgi:hypothetical protein